MSTPTTPAAGLQLVVVTGLSGAGRSTAAKCLEDLGWFVVDNLPPALLPTMVDLGSRSQGAVGKIAVVVDVRSRAFSSDLRTALEEIGGVPTETVTEDCHASLRMQKAGWRTAYLRVPLAAGLATERLMLHIGQRMRWDVAQHPGQIFFCIPAQILGQPAQLGCQLHIAFNLDCGRFACQYRLGNCQG